MTYKLRLTRDAEMHLDEIVKDKSKTRLLKDIRKTLEFMQTNLRHPSLNTHEYKSIVGENGEKVFEAYAQQKTPGAYRILWHYGPGRNIITIIAIIPHP